jgi:hypothetical protein
MDVKFELPKTSETKGDRREAKIFLAVGLTLSIWEFLEGELSALHLEVINPLNRYAMSRSLGAASLTPMNRSDMVKRAAQSSFFVGRQLEKDIVAFCNLIPSANDMRNNICHAVVGTRDAHNEDVAEGAEKYSGYFLMPHPFFSKKHHPDNLDLTYAEPKYSLTAGQILGYAHQFNTMFRYAESLVEQVKAFNQEFDALRSPHSLPGR